MASAHEPIDHQAAIVEARAAALVDTWHRAQATAGFGVSPTQLRALTVVERHGEMTISALAAELGTLLSSVSRLCDRLEASGLIARTPGIDDRRAVSVSLSRDGEAVFDRLRRRRREELARVLNAMPATAREALVAGLAGFHAAAEEEPGEPGGLSALALSPRPCRCRYSAGARTGAEALCTRHTADAEPQVVIGPCGRGGRPLRSVADRRTVLAVTR